MTTLIEGARLSSAAVSRGTESESCMKFIMSHKEITLPQRVTSAAFLKKDTSSLKSSCIAKRCIKKNNSIGKLMKQYSRTEVRKNFFSNQVIDTWNTLRDTTVQDQSMASMKQKLRADL